MAQSQARTLVPTKTRGLKRQTSRGADLKALHSSPTRGTDSILALQRTIGNQAVGQLLRHPAIPMRTSPVTPKVIGDSDKERLADRTADRIVRQISTSATRGASPPTTPASTLDHVRLAMRNLAVSRNLNAITIDASAAARSTADRIGALAYADGNRITFGTHSRHLPPDEKLRLTAHEVAHASLHPSSPQLGRRRIHAKLAGTHAAALSMGGDPKQGIRRFGPKRFQTNWKKAIDALQEYERSERDLFAKGTPDPQRLAQAKPQLVSLLRRIEANLESWKTANRYDRHAAELETTSSNMQREYIPTTDVDDHPDLEDTRPKGKVGRHQIVPLILTRVRNELKELHDGTWEQSAPLLLSDAGTTVGGSKSQLQPVTYQDADQGTKSGFFKREIALHEKREVQEDSVGIPVVNPNLGARSIAMYKLDQLLSAGVTAKVEYAVRNGELGTVIEKAKGQEARSLNWSIQPANTGRDGKVRANDPVLQQCLNKLQILDAIAGQLDRHSGNYYIQRDANSGDVTGVTGIDLDMAFGKNMNDPTVGTPTSQTAKEYRGVPKIFDEQMANKILSITDTQVHDAIDGLLSKEEVAATVSRFQHIKSSIAKAKEDGTLVSKWDDQSFKKAMPAPEQHNFDISGYVVDVSKSAVDDALNAARRTATDLIPKLFVNALPDTLDLIQTVFGRSIFPEEVRKLVLDMSLPTPLTPQLTANVLTRLADDKQWWVGQKLGLKDVTSKVSEVLPAELHKTITAPTRPARPERLTTPLRKGPRRPQRPQRLDKPKSLQQQPLLSPPLRSKAPPVPNRALKPKAK